MHMRLRIRGPYAPINGKGWPLWDCYDPATGNRVVGVSPMVAFRTWQSIYGKQS